MTPSSPGENPTLSLASLRRIDEACARFEEAWQTGQTPRIEDYLAGVQDPLRTALFLELFLAERELRADESAPRQAESYLERLPEYADLIRARSPDPYPTREGAEPPPGVTPKHPGPGSAAGPVPHVPGYAIVRELGRGGMGV